MKTWRHLRSIMWSKNSSTKQYIIYGFIDVKLQNRQNGSTVTESRWAVPYGRGGGKEGVGRKSTYRNFLGWWKWSTSRLEWSSTSTDICQNSSNCPCKMCILLYVNHTSIKSTPFKDHFKENMQKWGKDENRGGPSFSAGRKGKHQWNVSKLPCYLILQYLRVL